MPKRPIASGIEYADPILVCAKHRRRAMHVQPTEAETLAHPTFGSQTHQCPGRITLGNSASGCCGTRFTFGQEHRTTTGNTCGGCNGTQKVRFVKKVDGDTKEGNLEGYICKQCDWHRGNFSRASYHLSDFARKGALSARNWVANQILTGLRTDNRITYVQNLDFKHILSLLLWNAGEPTDKGSWPCVLSDICGKKASIEIEGSTIKDAWGVTCDFLRRQNIGDMGDFNTY